MIQNIDDNAQLELKMKEKGFLSVDQILFIELGMSMYQIFNNTFLVAFENFFETLSHQMVTRQRRRFNLGNPRIQLTNQTINYTGQRIWNYIPNEVKYSNHSLTNVTFNQN